jgi:DNA-directed RNA polymerase subunit RPC12/RpoP
MKSLQTRPRGTERATKLVCGRCGGELPQLDSGEQLVRRDYKGATVERRVRCAGCNTAIILRSVLN